MPELPDRRAVERQFEDIVRDNRFTIAVVFPLVGVVLLIAGSEGYLPEALATNPYLIVAANLVMVSPLIAGLLPLVDRRAVAGIGVLALFTWGIELTGVRTGLPYGEFEYLLDLGPMLFGLVPLALPVFFFPILLNSYLLVQLLLGPGDRSAVIRVPAALVVVLTMDLVLDPGAVALGFWGWTDPGAYYGVPAINYAGWVLSGTIALVLIELALRTDAVRTRLEHCEFLLDDLVSFVLFWGLVNAYFGNWVPVALAAALGAMLVRADRFDYAVVGDRFAADWR